jgi:predicted DNA binding CopG/RHH family protein
MTKKLKTLPKFKSEHEEREFWDTHNSTEYLDWNKAERASFPNLKPSSKAISIRIPEHMLRLLKSKAGMAGIPYQALIKKYIAAGIKKDR